MQFVEPYAVIKPQVDGVALLQDIEAIARVSHRSEDRQTADSWRRFILSIVVQHGDWSVVEHRSVTVEAVVDRGIQQEWTRHRLGAYTVESTRFVNYVKHTTGLLFVKPGLPTPVADKVWENTVQAVSDAYTAMLDYGIPPQIARSILPLALASKMYITYNLRMWRHFFLLRTTKETHPQMRQVTLPLLQQFKDTVPILYDDILPEARQVDNLNKAR